MKFISVKLPRHWPPFAKSAVLQVISLATYTVRSAASHAIENSSVHPLEIQLQRLEQQIGFLKEQSRIKDQRMSRIAAHRRPVYTGEERFEILQLKAAQNGSLRETAKQFLVAPATIASWLKRVDEDGPDALVKIPEPANKFPDFVRYSTTGLNTQSPLAIRSAL